MTNDNGLLSCRTKSRGSASRFAASIPRFAILFGLLLLASCSSGTCPTAKCTGGITFYVADIVGSLARGTNERLQICFDATCRDVTLSRANSTGTIFLAFAGVGTDAVHDITVTGAGSAKGTYKGKLASYLQKPNGATCAGRCALASVRIGNDGKVTPGTPAVPSTSSSVVPQSDAVVTSTSHA